MLQSGKTKRQSIKNARFLHAKEKSTALPEDTDNLICDLRRASLEWLPA